jgi:hypothetical protein
MRIQLTEGNTTKCNIISILHGTTPCLFDVSGTAENKRNNCITNVERRRNLEKNTPISDIVGVGGSVSVTSELLTGAIASGTLLTCVEFSLSVNTTFCKLARIVVATEI